ncbi:NAD(P)/FAD-dependent oxidoreductase [Pseudooceanicola nanhaiensis]|uniref:NAD(P)/FAD-dependent oxidoreductase n=1 Tax=Pseudooceanicola nanhaiensis TaxID=375761 RepID=UPI001CD5CC35|nr:FAD-dependent oxidoreductase [Pseudooceanicola nanhaiensis]MCA0920553.1 FAD-dependent oxidoreductase [Pseudooceanicola nanhaiensis]
MHIAVIGRGLIGSAAARHLAKAGGQVTLIGPDEPAALATHEGVFGSHYDEGRITRGLDPAPFWSRASRASIARYREIEAESGIAFYTEAGSLMSGPEGQDYIHRVASVRARDDIAADALTGAALAERFPYFGFPEGTMGLHEAKGAGHISPRRMVAAQTAAAERAGAAILRAEAIGIDPDAQGVTIRTSAGDLRADRVLVAAGAFTNRLLANALTLSVYARLVRLFVLDAEEHARLADMPSWIYHDASGDEFYMLPPIRYPDGTVALKIGGDPEDILLPDDAAMRDWFRSGGDPEVGAYLQAKCERFIPGLRAVEMRDVPCVTTYTPDVRPVLRFVDDRIAVAAGGNGRGAKNSDELGRLGALVVRDEALPDWALEPAEEAAE